MTLHVATATAYRVPGSAPAVSLSHGYWYYFFSPPT